MPSDLDVLVVDDSAPIRGYLSRVLERMGNRVMMAASGEEARAAFDGRKFDLVLLDLVLPDSDGLELLREMRGKDPESCVVMVTGHAEVASAIRAGQIGADGYINKNDVVGTSDSIDELLHQLDQSLGVRAGHRSRAELERMRGDLYAMVSHDLRNPINAIQLAASSIVEDFDPESVSPDVRHLAETIVRNTDSLLRQLNDFLDFSKLDAGMYRLAIKQGDLVQLAANAVEQMAPLARKRGHTLELEAPAMQIWARIDSRRLEQVLANFITNAIKYTVEPGHITVRVSAADTHARVAVTDTGLGVSEKELAMLFTRYGRGSSEAVRKIPGTGLGLLIVKQIVEAHGGRVGATSTFGKGSTFWLELPLWQGPPPSA